MNSNVGSIDRVVRVALGFVLLSTVFLVGEGLWWWGAIGLVPLLTGLMGWCPIYPLLGLNTCPARAR